MKLLFIQIKLLLLHILALLLISCASPYFGYSYDEWKKLSEIEQIEIKSEYEKIIATREIEKHQDTIDDITKSFVERADRKR